MFIRIVWDVIRFVKKKVPANPIKGFVNYGRMWSILGEDAIYLDIPYKFKDKIMSATTDDENGKKFKDFMDRSDIRFMINGETEECCFMIQVPDEYSPEDIQFMADKMIEAILRNDKAPVSVDGVEQDYKIIINNNKEPEIIGLRKTPGMSAAEIFKPILNGWASPGRENPSSRGRYME